MSDKSDTNSNGTDQRDTIIFGNWIGDGCPVCGEPVNAVLGPNNTISQPDEGEWCFEDGRFYIHEMFVWNNRPVDADAEQ